MGGGGFTQAGVDSQGAGDEGGRGLHPIIPLKIPISPPPNAGNTVGLKRHQVAKQLREREYAKQPVR